MFQHIVNLELRLKAIEEARAKEQHEITVLKKLLQSFNDRVKKLENEQDINVTNLPY